MCVFQAGEKADKRIFACYRIAQFIPGFLDRLLHMYYTIFVKKSLFAKCHNIKYFFVHF